MFVAHSIEAGSQGYRSSNPIGCENLPGLVHPFWNCPTSLLPRISETRRIKFTAIPATLIPATLWLHKRGKILALQGYSTCDKRPVNEESVLKRFRGAERGRENGNDKLPFHYSTISYH
jgi:hypothetical protein